jgi:methylated-DNA-[protein]-cysteine S-methyltransferase
VGVSEITYDAGTFGVGTLVRDHDGRLLFHELPRNVARPRQQGVGDPLADRLAAFFRGEPDDFADVDLDLSELTEFGRALALALRAIPRGEVVSYGELAALAGRPGAARAAGTFCAENRYPILIPCHRVVSAGGLGGYGSLGADYKRRLLALEHVAL